MVVVGREAWERQQQRAAAIEALHRLPTLSSSRPLALAAQIPVLLEQWQGSETNLESDRKMLENLRNLGSRSEFCDDATAAVTVAMLLRAWAAHEREESAYSLDCLGAWNAWKSSPGRGLAAIEAAGWTPWITSLLPQLPNWTNLGISLLNCAPQHSKVQDRLLVQLASHAKHALQAQNTVSSDIMRALDAFLLDHGLSEGSVDSGCFLALQRLEAPLDVWLSQNLNSNRSSGKKAEEFQVVCQLRARLAISLSIAGNGTLSEPAAQQNHNAEAVDTKEESNQLTSSMESCLDSVDYKALWDSILYLHVASKQSTEQPTVTNSLASESTTFYPKHSAVALAASAVVAALFEDFYDFPTMPASIAKDPNPVSPAKVLYASLNMLESLGPRSELRDVAVNVFARLLWALTEQVSDREHQTQLVTEFLYDSKYKNARKGLETRDCFRIWAHRQTTLLSNKLSTDEALEVQFVGEEGPSIDAAVNVVFPAALLCPEMLLEALVAGAVADGGKAALLCGLLEELPALWDVVTDNLVEQPLILKLLKERLRVSALQLLSEKDRAALQNCIIALCSSSQASTAVSKPGRPFNELVMLYAVVPALEAFVTSKKEGKESFQNNADEITTLLRLTSRLLQLHQNASTDIISHIISQNLELGTPSTSLGQFLFDSFCQPILDLSSRRIDYSSQGLSLPLSLIEQAHELRLLCVPISAPTSVYYKEELLPQDAATVWQIADALCTVLEDYLLSTETGRILDRIGKLCSLVEATQLREAAVLACALVFPCCAPAEVEMLSEGFQQIVGSILRCSPPSTVINSVHVQVAYIEVVCRAVHAVALIPGLVPLADEDLSSLTSGPSILRSKVVARLCQKLSLLCQFYTASSVKLSAAKAAFAARCFIEVSRCGASLSAFYETNTLEVCLLHIIQVLKHENAALWLPKGVLRLIEEAAAQFPSALVQTAVAGATAPAASEP